MDKMKTALKRKGRKEFYFRKEKEVRALWERWKLISKYRYRPWNKENLVPLPKPIRRGWVRYYIVRPDIAKSNRGAILNKILSIVQSPAVCDNKQFVTNRDEDGNRIHKKRESRPIHQEPKWLSQKEFEEQIAPNEQMIQYFSLVEKTRRWGGPIKVYVFNRPWMFSFKIKPHFVTHGYYLNTELISEYEYINDKLWNSDMLAVKYLPGMAYHDYDYNEPRKVKLAKIAKKEAREEAEFAMAGNY